jgi:dipeptidyl aminopeptidase/acylaminoacyl peptidase
MFCKRLPVLLLILPVAFAQKRPLTQADFDSWRHIQNQVLSNDGRYLAYALFPQQGDGELVIRELKTSREVRQPIGELPAPPPPDYSHPQREEAPPAAPGISIRFSGDSRFLVASTFPARDAVEQAKRERAKAEKERAARSEHGENARRNAPLELPPGDLIVANLAAGKVTRVPRVRSFQLPSDPVNYVAYIQLPEDTPASEHPAPSEDHERNRRKPSAGDLLLRDLASGSERRFAQVAEYTFLRNGKMLVYAVSVRGENDNGVFLVRPSDSEDDDPTALLSGSGHYQKLAWDVDQTRLAFLSDHDHPKTPAPVLDLWTWDGQNRHAAKLAAGNAPGLPEGWQISSKASLTVAKGGERIFFGTAPVPPAPPTASDTPEDERVSVDLWSWKDDYIQPMQIRRARSERARSYRAVYDLRSKRCLQLSDPDMNDLLPSDDGAYAIGNDDRAYRRMEEYDAPYLDSYIVDVSSGERKLIARKHPNRVIWSPSSQYAIYFDGKNWIAIDVPNAREINLTAKLAVSFANEENDTPGLPDSYRLAGWTRDSRYVLLYDRYDIWQCAPDGSSAVNLTASAGRKNRLQFRVVRFETDDPASRWINPAERLLLRAENDRTHDSGFYETTLNATAAPRKLVFDAKNFAVPIKARNADVYITAASTYDQYPDLLLSTDGSFRLLSRVTNAAPQLANLLWGKAELVPFTNSDGASLQAILYKPDNFDPKKKYPLIVYIYERLTQNIHNFIEPKPANTISPSYYTSHGYLVLEPDIVYKVGYPGESALGCVLPAVQAVANRGYVNESAIGIQGHSWGGYQIAYMITRTNRFRAAAAGAPVVDMISSYDGIRWGPGIPRQFQYERTQSRIGGSVWQYPLRYIENSPIFAADRVKTPLLMLHNDADDAVPWYQGIEFYLALRRLSKEVYLFNYNGEPHNLRRRANQKDFTERLKDYFDFYLKGGPEPEWMTNGIPYLEKPGISAALSTDDPH